MDPTDTDDALDRFETIWRHVECGIALIDAATRTILDINPVAAHMFGDAKEKIIGKKCHKFICPAESDACPILDKGQIVDRSERKFVKADGDFIPIIKSVAKIQYNGKLALLESFADISNLKATEEKLRILNIAEQANRAKGDFLSRMSHEIRTPMNAIIGMTKIAEHTDDIAKLKHCISMIGISSVHLLELINDVLDISKIEAGKFELDYSSFDIEAIIKKISTFIVVKTEEKDIKFYIKFNKIIKQYYMGDELRISQIIINLLSNAVKFTPIGGKITLEVDEMQRLETGSLLRFTVSDTGPGMSHEQLGKLFNAFEQTDINISKKFGGTGLGLAISKSIIDKMNGIINVYSTYGYGTTFTVDITLDHNKQIDKELLDTCEQLPEAKIIIIDSDGENREQLCAILYHSNIRVDEAENGEMALSLITAAHDDNSPHDIIFLAHDMPEISGIEILKKMDKRTNPATVVIMMPFLKWNRVDSEVESFGVTRCIAYPLFPSDVMHLVKEILDSRTPSMKTVAYKEATVPDFSHLTLLLAEDIDINREIFSALLEPTEIHIDIAEDGREAVEKFRNAPDKYDIIVMDVQMPNMDGYEATRTIRALDFVKAKLIPIIAMTADVFKEDIEKCLACGMNDHLAKPIDEDLVIEKIRTYC
jgi:PAS domain S-box-containing protein